MLCGGFDKLLRRCSCGHCIISRSPLEISPMNHRSQYYVCTLVATRYLELSLLQFTLAKEEYFKKYI